MIEIALPDGSKRPFEHPVTVQDVAASIGAGLAKATLAGKVDGKLVDASFAFACAGRAASVPGRAGHDRSGDR
jgi:threonyl-tRNA synthetase